MVEREFEAGLERLFAQPSAYPDAEDFASRVENRLNRSWRVRTWGIGVAGVVGGLVAISQALGSGLLPRIQAASFGSAEVVGGWYDKVFAQGEALLTTNSSASLFWVVSALLVAAAGVTASRMVDEL